MLRSMWVSESQSPIQVPWSKPISLVRNWLFHWFTLLLAKSRMICRNSDNKYQLKGERGRGSLVYLGVIFKWFQFVVVTCCYNIIAEAGAILWIRDFPPKLDEPKEKRRTTRAVVMIFPVMSLHGPSLWGTPATRSNIKLCSCWRNNGPRNG